jgi:hypothetical protein
MALVRTIRVLVKLPGNKTQTITESVPADWVSGEKDAITEVLENAKVRTKIAVSADYLISAQISDPWDPTQSVRILRG